MTSTTARSLYRRRIYVCQPSIFDAFSFRECSFPPSFLRVLPYYRRGFPFVHLACIRSAMCHDRQGMRGCLSLQPFVLSDGLLSVCLIWIDGCRLKGALCIPLVPLNVIRFVSVSSVVILFENVTGMLRCVPRHVRADRHHHASYSLSYLCALLVQPTR